MNSGFAQVRAHSWLRNARDRAFGSLSRRASTKRCPGADRPYHKRPAHDNGLQPPASPPSYGSFEAHTNNGQVVADDGSTLSTRLAGMLAAGDGNVMVTQTRWLAMATSPAETTWMWQAAVSLPEVARQAVGRRGAAVGPGDRLIAFSPVGAAGPWLIVSHGVGHRVEQPERDAAAP